MISSLGIPKISVKEHKKNLFNSNQASVRDATKRVRGAALSLHVFEDRKEVP